MTSTQSSAPASQPQLRSEIGSPTEASDGDHSQRETVFRRLAIDSARHSQGDSFSARPFQCQQCGTPVIYNPSLETDALVGSLISRGFAVIDSVGVLNSATC